MKSFGHWLIYPMLLSLLMACGKDNKSGKSGTSSSWDLANPYMSGYNGYNIPTVSSPYSSNGVHLNQVMEQNRCANNNAYQRIPIQISLTGFMTVVSPSDMYVGVTSFGDVAAVIGTAPGQAPIFVAYMCPRSFSPTGQGQLLGVNVGANTRCLVKPITAATVVFPGGATAEFRWMDGGTSMGQRFSFCY